LPLKHKKASGKALCSLLIFARKLPPFFASQEQEQEPSVIVNKICVLWPSNVRERKEKMKGIKKTSEENTNRL